MPRPLRHSQEEIITLVTDVFWKQGYNNTSIQDLEKVTGLSRKSIYNAFGSKEKLFFKVLARYTRDTKLYLAEAGSELASIVNVFKMFAIGTVPSKSNKYGCLMANTIVDIHSSTAQVQDAIKEFREIILGYFLSVLTTNKKQLKENVNIQDSSELLVSTLWGVFLVNRLYSSPLVASQVVSAVEQIINNLQE